MLNRFRAAVAGFFMKAAGLSFTPAWLAATFIDIAFRTLVQEGYKKNSAVFACLAYLQRTFPEPPFRVYQPSSTGPRSLDRHPLRQLLRRPNPHMGEDA